MKTTLACAIAAWLTAAGFLHADEVLRPLKTDAQRGPNLLQNAGFEEIKDGLPVAWTSELAKDWTADTTTAYGGKISARFQRTPDGKTYWISQRVTLNRQRATPLVVSGWSKAEGVQGARGGEYSVWVDLQYMDGTPLWGQKAPFEVGTHDWQYAEKSFLVSKPVRTVTVNVLFRNGVSGRTWFDDIALQELQTDGGLVFDRQPAKVPAAVASHGAPRQRLESADGLALAFDVVGRPAALQAQKQSLLGDQFGGFWLRDAAANGPWLRPTLAARATKGTITWRSTAPQAGLNLEVEWNGTAFGHDFHVTLIDTTGKDRAVTAYFVLPLADRPWTWHDDILHATATGPDAEYSNTGPSSGVASAYPFCSLTCPEAGLSLAVPMDHPRVARLVYNSRLRVLYLACDLGIVRDTVNYPSRADFRFSLTHHDSQWGFRAATAKYWERYPQFFERRLKTGGIWMAFADISKVKDWQDFGFAYDEHSATPLEFDNANGIASFSYIEPMTYWLPMARDVPRTYEGAMQALADNEKSGKPAPVGWAKLTRRCGAFTREQRYDLALHNTSWCDGAVFTLNPDPNIPEDADCPLNKAHWSYSKVWADKHLLLPTGPRLDGIYLDSLPNWGEVRNWRREHWRTVTVPLTFDPDRREPVLQQIFSTWQFAKWVADDVHTRGGVMHGNGGTCWPYFPALLDVTGQETGGILSPQTMAMARTLLRDKPYSPLLNTRFENLPADYHVSYFHRSALYCIFPSYFNGSYFQDGKWITAHFFKQPELYEQVRPLYKQWIPILRRMYATGWQPVTLASVSDGCRVERYGPGGGKEVLFAVYNPGKQAVTAKLDIEAGALKLDATGKATGLVSATELAATRQPDTLEITVPLAADRCEVVRIGK